GGSQTCPASVACAGPAWVGSLVPTCQGGRAGSTAVVTAAPCRRLPWAAGRRRVALDEGSYRARGLRVAAFGEVRHASAGRITDVLRIPAARRLQWADTVSG